MDNIIQKLKELKFFLKWKRAINSIPYSFNIGIILCIFILIIFKFVTLEFYKEFYIISFCIFLNITAYFIYNLFLPIDLVKVANYLDFKAGSHEIITTAYESFLDGDKDSGTEYNISVAERVVKKLNIKNLCKLKFPKFKWNHGAILIPFFVLVFIPKYNPEEKHVQVPDISKQNEKKLLELSKKFALKKQKDIKNLSYQIKVLLALSNKKRKNNKKLLEQINKLEKKTKNLKKDLELHKKLKKILGKNSLPKLMKANNKKNGDSKNKLKGNQTKAKNSNKSNFEKGKKNSENLKEEKKRLKKSLKKTLAKLMKSKNGKKKLLSRLAKFKNSLQKMESQTPFKNKKLKERLRQLKKKIQKLEKQLKKTKKEEYEKSQEEYEKLRKMLEELNKLSEELKKALEKFKNLESTEKDLKQLSKLLKLSKEDLKKLLKELKKAKKIKLKSCKNCKKFNPKCKACRKINNLGNPKLLGKKNLILLKKMLGISQGNMNSESTNKDDKQKSKTFGYEDPKKINKEKKWEKLYPELKLKKKAINTIIPKNKKGEGNSINLEEFRGAPDSPDDLKVPVTKVLHIYRKEAQKHIDEGKIPSEYKNYVKKYFNKLDK